jgi:glycosyltransferase involved in cell wall biosynthesis
VRILKIAPTSFFADYGCHVRILEEARALQRLGHSVAVCTYHNGADVEGVPIVRIPRLPWHAEVRVGSHWHKLYFDMLLLCRTLLRRVRERPDIIHAHLHEGAFVGYLPSRLWGVPLIFDYQGSLTAEMIDHCFLRAGSVAEAPLRRLERLINRSADVIVTSSANAARWLQQQQPALAGRVFTVADCVDTNRFVPAWEWPAAPAERAELRARWRIPTEHQVIVFLGLLAEYQGIGHLLRAARTVIAQRPATHFLIMGYPGVERYTGLAHELGICSHVIFTGRVPYADAPRYLRQGDVAVSAKLSKTEGNGKLLNYMAVGLPTVTFDTPVAHEILGELGLYAQTGDARSLADQLERLLRDESERRARGRALRERAVQEFSWWTAGQQILAVYEAAQR